MKMNGVGIVIPANTEVDISALSINELELLMTKCAQRRDQLQREKDKKAYNDFVNAYRNFRQSCPHCMKLWDDEIETSDAGVRYVEFDLYEMMDRAFL